MECTLIGILFIFCIMQCNSFVNVVYIQLPGNAVIAFRLAVKTNVHSSCQQCQWLLAIKQLLMMMMIYHCRELCAIFFCLCFRCSVTSLLKCLTVNMLVMWLGLKFRYVCVGDFSSVYSCEHVPSVLSHCWLGGRKGIRTVKNWVVGCWRGYLSGARCRLVYGPADSTATHCLLLQ